MLCDKCHQRAATVHLTFIFGEKMQKKDYCVVCAPSEEQIKQGPSKALGADWPNDLLTPAKQSQQAGEGSPTTIRESKCDYCGAPAVGGSGWGSGMWCADGTKIEENHSWCEKCQEDLNKFNSRPENRLPDFPADFDFGDPKAIEPVERLMHEIEERKKAFMRQRVAERKGPDHAGSSPQ